MTRERDERMWNLAYRLAESGEHRDHRAIEWELRAFGYPRAAQLPSESAKGWRRISQWLPKRLEVPGRGSIIFAASVGGVVVSASAVGVG